MKQYKQKSIPTEKQNIKDKNIKKQAKQKWNTTQQESAKPHIKH